ncbi:permease [Paradesulfitobacterium aromaticivorans]
MAIGLPSSKRKYGAEQPYIPLGIFKLRLPFIHYGIEVPEIIQAIFMFVTGLAATKFLEDMFGIPFEVALTIVLFHEITYSLHQLFGDPIIAGWITPAIPLTVAFLSKFTLGVDRIEALIALQITVGVMFLILGSTGLAKKILDVLPNSIKAGIVLGAGIAAIVGKYGFLPAAQGGVGFAKYPVSMSVGIALAFFLLYAKGFEVMKAKGGSIVGIFAKYGMVPGIIGAMVVGIAVGEVQMPKIDQWGFFVPRVGEVFSTFNAFAVGIPSLSTFIAALPMAIVAYIIAFGDIIIGQTVIEKANEFRDDEYIDMNANRTNILCGVRNLIEGTMFPTVTLAGPLWAAMTVAVAERYKQGRKAMDSIFGGSGTFNIVKWMAILSLPLVAFFKPILPIAIALTTMVQGFACFYIAIEMLKTKEEQGVAGVLGAILAIAGPTYGLASGIVLYLVVQKIGVPKMQQIKVVEKIEKAG